MPRFELEDIKKRKTFNLKSDKKFRWSETIPWQEFGFEFESLRMDSHHDGPIESLQEAIGVTPDGLVGKQTLQAVVDYFLKKRASYWNPYTGQVGCRHPDRLALNVKWNGLDVPVFVPHLTAGTITHDLSLHESGNFTKKDRTLDSIIVHWGGLDPEHLHRVFSNRDASSHFGIGLDDEGKPYVAQYLDVAHIAWHAKGANETSIGLDICQQPLVKWLGHYKKKGYDVRVISNPAEGFGPQKVLNLDDRIALLTKKFLEGLAVAFNISSEMAETPRRVKEPFLGILGHSNVDTKGQGKWDIAPWWDKLKAL